MFVVYIYPCDGLQDNAVVGVSLRTKVHRRGGRRGCHISMRYHHALFADDVDG